MASRHSRPSSVPNACAARTIHSVPTAASNFCGTGTSAPTAAPPPKQPIVPTRTTFAWASTFATVLLRARIIRRRRTIGTLSFQSRRRLRCRGSRTRPGGSRPVAVPARRARRFHPAPPAAVQPNRKGPISASRLDARAPGGRSPLRSPDSPLESQDAPLHLHGARRHLHHRPATDARAPRGGARLRAQPRRAQRHDALRRHEEAEPGRRLRARRTREHAVREPPLARRPAHELADDLRPDRPPPRAPPPEGGGPARAPAREGAHPHARRAREA